MPLEASLDFIGALVRAPHGQGTGDVCAVAQIPIATAGGFSSAAIAIPYDGTVLDAGSKRSAIYLTIDADQGVDVHVRFGLAGLTAATTLDKTIPAGGSLQVACFRTKETIFRVYANVASDGDNAATYYCSGIDT